jgi:amino acid transporter
MPQSEHPVRLVRAMGRWDLVALTVNSIIGSGIFFLPAAVAGLVGSFGPFSYIVSAVLTLTFILSFAEVSSRFETGGGPYRYAYHAFGPFAGFQIGWLVYLTRVAATAAACNLFVFYLADFLPAAAHDWGKIVTLLLLTGSLALINVRGVKYGALTIDLITVAKVLPLLLIIAGGIFKIDAANLAPGPLPSFGNFMRSLFLLTFAFGGFEVMTIPSGETINPRFHVPRALITGTLVVAAIYFMIQLAAAGVLPSLSTDLRPLATLAGSIMGPAGAHVVAAGAVASTFGLIGANILGAPRLTFALGESRQLPSVFAHVHPVFRSPDVSIMVCAAILFLLSALSDFVTLAAISVVSRLLYYFSTCASALVFRRKERAAFNLPLGAAIPVAGMAFACFLLGFARMEEMYYTIGGIVAGTALYLVVRAFRLGPGLGPAGGTVHDNAEQGDAR